MLVWVSPSRVFSCRFSCKTISIPEKKLEGMLIVDRESRITQVSQGELH